MSEEESNTKEENLSEENLEDETGDDDIIGGDIEVESEEEDTGEKKNEDDSVKLVGGEMAINTVNEKSNLIPKDNNGKEKTFNALMFLPIISAFFSLIGVLVPLIIYLVRKGNNLQYAPPIWIFSESQPEYEISISLLSIFSICFSLVCIIKFKALDSIKLNKFINLAVLCVGFCIPFGLLFLLVWRQDYVRVCHEIGGWMLLLSMFLYFSFWMFYDYYYRLLNNELLIPFWLMVVRTIIYLLLLMNVVSLIALIIVFYVDPKLGESNTFLSINSACEYLLFFVLFPLLQFTCILDMRVKDKRKGFNIK